jgi:hypothetical protein
MSHRSSHEEAKSIFNRHSKIGHYFIFLGAGLSVFGHRRAFPELQKAAATDNSFLNAAKYGGITSFFNIHTTNRIKHIIINLKLLKYYHNTNNNTSVLKQIGHQILHK